MDFTVERIEDVKYIVEFCGTLQKKQAEDMSAYVGDFSSIKKEGDYIIHCGDEVSRYFVIHSGVYESAVRAMLGYFTWQRCGSELGWAEKCHMDDGLLEDGTRAELHGGYHQSCDLRKSPAGVSIGVLAMLQSSLKDKTSWGKILFDDEIRWASDYYVRTIQADGRMYNTLNAPFGWEGRKFYKSAAPASAQWCVTMILVLASKLVKERSDEFMSAALRSWDYLVSEERPERKYEHPDEAPYGMDPAYFYTAIYKNSNADMAYRATCAAMFYRITENKKWLDELAANIEKLVERVNDGIFTLDTDDEALLQCSGSYSWCHGAEFAFCDGAELLKGYGIHKECVEVLNKVVDNLKELADKALYSKPPLLYSEKDINKPTGHHRKGEKPRILRDTLGKLYTYRNKYFYVKSENYGSTRNLFNGVLLRRAARVLKRNELNFYAQAIADYLLGCNPMDASHVEGIGYNQMMRGVFGQFFPSTPQIPGGVTVGYTKNALHAEYDMPCVGFAMWLLADIMNG